MTRALAVYLGERRAGTLRCEIRASSFTYDPDYLRAPDATPLSLSIPLRPGIHEPDVVDPFLWGLLPDNPETLQRWALDARPQADEHNPFSLLQHYGRDCAGAVQFLDESESLDRPSGITPVDDREIAAQLSALDRDPNAWTFNEDDGRFSLAGAQAKFALTFSNGHWGIPHGSIPTTHIFKPGIPEYREQALNEHVCVSLAKRLGLATARTKIRSFEGRHAIVVERYDRRLTGDRYERVHQEDLCQAFGVPPSQKYQDDGGPSIHRVAGLLRRVQRSERAADTVRRYLLSVAFNWLIAAPDAHAKNYSLLLRGRTVALAPLYDIATITPYENYRAERIKIAQSVNGLYLVGAIGADDWHAEATRVELDGDQFISELRELASRAPTAVQELCTSGEVLAIAPDFAGELAEALLLRIAEATRQLAG